MSALARAKMLMDLGRLLNGLDLGKIKEALFLFQAAANGDLELNDRVTNALKGLRLVAEMTPTERDDELLQILDRLLNSSLKDSLIEVVKRSMEAIQSSQIDDGTPKELRDAMAAQQLNPVAEDVISVQAMNEMEQQYAAQFTSQAIPWGIILQLARMIAKQLL